MMEEKTIKRIFSPYETDASGIIGNAMNVVQPKTVGEARKIISESLRIVPRGAGTGLVGGAVPLEGQDVVLDLSKLNSIGIVDRDRRTIEVEVGLVLDDLQEHLEVHGLEFPVNPSSHSVCTIGGMIATNAFGSRVLKYGKTSSWIRWLDIMDSNGNIERKGITEISDYVGFEGITGVIIKACLNLSPIKSRSASLVELNDLSNIVMTVSNLKRNRDISAIDFFDKLTSKELGLNNSYHLFIEYEDDSGLLSKEEYEIIVSRLEKTYPVLASLGYKRIEDFKLMLDRIPELINWFEEKGIPSFGNISVGVIHPCLNDKQLEFIPEINRIVKRHGGLSNAKHGVGLLKKEYVEFNDRKIIENVKKRTDFLNKFNLGKVI